MVFAFMLDMGSITLNGHIKIVKAALQLYIKFSPSKGVASSYCQTSIVLIGKNEIRLIRLCLYFELEGRTIFFRHIDSEAPQRHSMCDTLLLLENSLMKN